jgi:starch phosphorylase
MVQSLFADFAKIFPTRFCNVTNGVTPRRWLALANQPLSEVLDANIGRTWRTDLGQLGELEQHIDFRR